MKKQFAFWISLCLVLFLFSCQSDETSQEIMETENKEDKIPSTLPFQKIELSDLSDFTTKGKNWQIVGDIFADRKTKHAIELTEGKGILVNQQTESERAHIFTNFEHGDLEIELEFMMPKGSNSGIYFQSRYEIQLFDSYGVENPKVRDCGSIYERWDESRAEGKKGYEGHPTKTNTSKAPGLWQHLKIYFRAPQFDQKGKKIKNAQFEHVYHNGFLIHKNVELKGTTRAAPVKIDDEVAYAPLMIQGDHGPVAIRNIKYKSYTQDSLSLSNITYKRYQIPEDNKKLPIDLDSLKLVHEGTTDFLDVSSLNGELEDYFAIQFEADLQVTIPGDYLLKTYGHDGASLYVNDSLIVKFQSYRDSYGMVNLDKGMHKIKIEYFHHKWIHRLFVGYEGPGIFKRNFPNEVTYNPWEKKPKPTFVFAKDGPELIRSFVMRDGKKRTHCISVGEPSGWNYSYDLSEASLLRLWKGDFLDVTHMWEKRGEPQLSHPLNAFIEGASGVALTQLSQKDSPWKKSKNHSLDYKGYQIQSNGLPIFKYHFGSAKIEDVVKSAQSKNGITRSFSIKENNLKQLYLRIAYADAIKKTPDDLYSIGGQYYLKLGENMPEPILRNINKKQELLFPVKGDTTIEYDFIW